MSTRGMRIAKADEQDIKELSEYLLRNEQKNSKLSKTFPHGWRRVIMAAQSLIENCCDPTEDTLAYSPYLEEKNVDNEQ